ncbi:MAG: hypothetical protein MHPSP_001500, partial [Paramarteilia canceri]
METRPKINDNEPKQYKMNGTIQTTLNFVDKPPKSNNVPLSSIRNNNLRKLKVKDLKKIPRNLTLLNDRPKHIMNSKYNRYKLSSISENNTNENKIMQIARFISTFFSPNIKLKDTNIAKEKSARNSRTKSAFDYCDECDDNHASNRNEKNLQIVRSK